MLGRLERAGSTADDMDTALARAGAGDELAASLLEAVRTARRTGVDAEATLRTALARLPQP
jgi:hypothetical protein